MARTKTQKILRFSVIALAVTALVGVLSFFLVIRPLQIRHEKAEYDKAEAQIDSLAAKIQSTIGKADGTKKEKSCGRAHLLTEKGALGCDITLSLLFKNADDVQATILMNKIGQFGKGNLRSGSGGVKGSAFQPGSEARGVQIFYQDFGTSSKTACAFGYDFPAKERDTFKDASDNSFQLDISCGGSALSEYYPQKSVNKGNL